MFRQNIWISPILVSYVYYVLLHSHEIHNSILHTTSHLLLVPIHTSRFLGNSKSTRVSCINSSNVVFVEYFRFCPNPRTDLQCTPPFLPYPVFVWFLPVQLLLFIIFVDCLIKIMNNFIFCQPYSIFQIFSMTILIKMFQ